LFPSYKPLPTSAPATPLKSQRNGAIEIRLLLLLSLDGQTDFLKTHIAVYNDVHRNDFLNRLWPFPTAGWLGRRCCN